MCYLFDMVDCFTDVYVGSVIFSGLYSVSREDEAKKKDMTPLQFALSVFNYYLCFKCNVGLETWDTDQLQLLIP